MKSYREILLVEDSLNDIELTLEALKGAGILNPITVVRDGEEALEYLQRQGRYKELEKLPPAVVLLDLKLPKLSGLEVLRVIKSDSMLKVLPVVMLTSSREETDLTKSYELGVNSFVVKPIDFQQFIEAVRQVGCFWTLVNEIPKS